MNVRVKLLGETYVTLDLTSITPILKYDGVYYCWAEFADFVSTPNGEYVRAQIQVVGVDAGDPVPVNVVLHCPNCRALHIDEPNALEGWLNPPHRSHKCQYCECIWRAADVPTNGIAYPQSRGANDTYPPARREEA